METEIKPKCGGEEGGGGGVSEGDQAQQGRR